MGNQKSNYEFSMAHNIESVTNSAGQGKSKAELLRELKGLLDNLGGRRL